MHENERNQQDSAYDKDFYKLVEVLHEQDDSGMVAFESTLKDAQEYLLDTYVRSDTPIDYKDLADVEQDLAQEWPHEGSVARLSGRLYLNDLEEEDEVEKVLGAGAQDETGQKYFIVENREFKSAGIDTLTTHRGDGSVSDIKIVYTFSMLEDEDDLPTLRADPNDLYEHVYEKPTPQQVLEQLEQHWPQQFLLLREWMHFGGETPLPARLQYITNELQKQLAESEEFRRYVECYLQEFIVLDQTHPFNLIISGNVDYYEGSSSPYSEGQNAEWSRLAVEGKLQAFGYYPKIELVKRNNGTVDATMMFATYNTEDGDAAEYIRLNADTIQFFRPTRAIDSLASRAMMGSYDSLLQAVPEETFSTLSIDSSEEVSEGGDEGEQDSQSTEIPELIQGLVELEEIFSYIVKLVEARRTVGYASSDDALKASRSFIQNEMGNMLRRFGTFSNLELTVSGTSIMQPQGTIEFAQSEEDVQQGKKTFAYTANYDQPIQQLQEGDVLTGIVADILPGVSKEEGFLDNAPTYKIHPGILLSVERRGHAPIAIGDIPLFNISTDERVLVPLVEETDIKFTTLERYRESQNAVRELDKSYPETHATHFIDTLNRALLNEEGNLINFEHTDLFASLKKKSIDSEGGEALFVRVANAIEKLLIGRKLHVRGDAYKREEGGEYTQIPLDEDIGIFGTVVDVRADAIKGEIFISMNVGPDSSNPKTVVHVEAHTMNAFRF